MRERPGTSTRSARIGAGSRLRTIASVMSAATLMPRLFVCQVPSGSPMSSTTALSRGSAKPAGQEEKLLCHKLAPLSARALAPGDALARRATGVEPARTPSGGERVVLARAEDAPGQGGAVHDFGEARVDDAESTSAARGSRPGTAQDFTSSTVGAPSRSASRAASPSEVIDQSAGMRRSRAQRRKRDQTGPCPPRARAQSPAASRRVSRGSSAASASPVWCMASSAMRVASSKASAAWALRTASAKGPPPGTMTTGRVAAPTRFRTDSRRASPSTLPPIFTTSGRGGHCPRVSLVTRPAARARDLDAAHRPALQLLDPDEHRGDADPPGSARRCARRASRRG